ncbi:MAG: hypothetical protein HY332_11025 [Chloroflexi bacterium]|nr:hypothetical protein [Chloroflexota bacterium]
MTADVTARTITLVAETSPGPPGEHGMARLAGALERLGWQCLRKSTVPQRGECALAVVATITAAMSPIVHRLAAHAGYELPSRPEAVGFCPLSPADGRPATILIAGGDERGLMYALLEAARRIERSGATPDAGPGAVLALFPESSESPERAIRSVCIFPHHAGLEREWYRSLAFWRWYFDLLALHRFNAFSLTFSHQTAYLTPPYPYFVAIPEHPEVTVPSLREAERDENLALLRAISRLAVERGIDFTLGVWSQHAYRYGRSRVAGLSHDNLSSFCGHGMRRLLEACPDISGVQLRVNAESGVHLDEGAAFWRTIFAGIRACGRPIRLDLRAKGIVDDTIAAGLDTGLPVTVSTKFWTEHQGLPYHATQLQDGDRFVRRHSYGDQLRYPREYAFQFRLWNLGTNKFFLWADPDWVRRFAASTTLGGARGFEVCAPLSNKGFGEQGGVWRIFADPSYEHYEWEQQRYWFWYLLFGRLGYSGAADPSVWRREWASRLGAQAAPLVEQALQEASRFLPLITASHSPSASVFTYWPEKDMGGLLDLYLQVEPSDVGMFASVQDSVQDAVRGTPRARQTPRQLSARFTEMAERAEVALAAAQEVAEPANDAAARELRGVALDVRVQAALARYHAAKLLAAEHLAAFYATGDLDSLCAARPEARRALEAWEQVVALTKGVYQDDMIFGRLDEQSGHWENSLVYARHDVERLDEVETLFQRYGLFDYGFDFGGALPPRTGSPPMPYLHDYRVERRFIGVSPQSLYAPETGWGWGVTYGLVATEAPKIPGGTLRAASPHPAGLPREALYRDFVGRDPAAPYDKATFVVDLPDSDYDVCVILADRSVAPADHGPLVVKLQYRDEIGPVHLPAGEIVELRRRVLVQSGRLEIELNAPPQGDWLITGLVVTRVAPHIGHRPPLAVRSGEPFAVRATVTSPEPLQRVAVHYRFDPHAPFAARALLPVASDPRFHSEIDVPATASWLEYYLEATDARGTGTNWPARGAAAPRCVAAGHATTPPRIEHKPIRHAKPGEPLEIRARVTAGAPLARVTLHYRNVNQMQAHDHLAMTRIGPEHAHGSDGGADACIGEFVATIPGAHVTPAWDLMYHLEAVDALGNATFFPGLAAGTPYVVTTVARP